jgi:hypothetical protein
VRAINHALTGAAIGVTVHNPYVAVPAALVSHLICDVIPHFGTKHLDVIKTRKFTYALIIDAVLCGGLVLALFLSGTQYWFLASVCAFVAAAPDFISIRRFITVHRNRKFTPNRLERFLSAIQWFERPIGAVVEVAWFVTFAFVLAVQLW